ncbi:unnamed protein product [Gadus morhua 'NCC']
MKAARNGKETEPPFVYNPRLSDLPGCAHPVSSLYLTSCLRSPAASREKKQGAVFDPRRRRRRSRPCQPGQQQLQAEQAAERVTGMMDGTD